ncbi:MAG: PAS domain S-box-containing protein [Candidatus Azotimanducaceae bacterium]|jgi:PAS domain S-box-containing protein
MNERDAVADEASVDVGHSGMSEPEIRILILEDDPADVALLKLNMEKGGLSFTARVVETQDGLLEELHGFRPDVIISDYTLPSFSGTDALRLVREESWDLPFILVSGTISEEQAIEALQLQATDYLLKGNLGRLVPALKRALSEREQRQSEANALRVSEAKARSLADHSSDMMALISDDCEILDLSPASLTMLGYEPQELVGRSLTDLVSAEDLDLMRVTRDAVKSSGLASGTWRFRRKDGSEVWVAARMRSRRDSGSNACEIHATFRDVTERRLAAIDLQTVYDDAMHALRAKSAFFANMSHEMRTPMDGVLAMAQRLLDTDLSADQRECAESIVSLAESLLAVVNDVLDFSKIDGAQLGVESALFEAPA